MIPAYYGKSSFSSGTVGVQRLDSLAPCNKLGSSWNCLVPQNSMYTFGAVTQPPEIITPRDVKNSIRYASLAQALPVSDGSFRCAGPGNCVPSVGGLSLQDCSDTCPGRDKTGNFDCIGGQCLPSDSGAFTSREACQSQCSNTAFDCFDGKCSASPYGKFTSLQACQAYCSSPDQDTFDCLNGECILAYDGTFTSMQACKSYCGSKSQMYGAVVVPGRKGVTPSVPSLPSQCSTSLECGRDTSYCYDPNGDKTDKCTSSKLVASCVPDSQKWGRKICSLALKGPGEFQDYNQPPTICSIGGKPIRQVCMSDNARCLGTGVDEGNTSLCGQDATCELLDGQYTCLGSDPGHWGGYGSYI
jgi:hypothetical protein